MKISSDQRSNGNKVTLAGMIAQFVSYLCFMALVTYCRFRGVPNLRRTMVGRYVDKILMMLATSSFFILVRLVYRVIELSGGEGNSVQKNEACFFVFDAAPMLLAISVWLLWPSRIVYMKTSDIGFQGQVQEDCKTDPYFFNNE